MNTRTYRIIIEPDENNTYHAYAPALAGCHTWGETLDEAKANIREAIGVYIASLVADKEDVPEETGMELLETISFPAQPSLLPA